MMAIGFEDGLMFIDRRAYCVVETVVKVMLRGGDGPCTAAEIAAWVDESPNLFIPSWPVSTRGPVDL